jgi:hypothetical protein
LAALAVLLNLMVFADAQEPVIEVRADEPARSVSRLLTGACIEDVNHEIYGGIYSQMVFGESFQEPPKGGGVEISGLWRPVQAGGAVGSFGFETNHPFIGRQSQRLTFLRGEGQVGVENQGLNRWGMHFIEGKPYEGVVWARADRPVDLFVAIENGDGSQRLAEQRLSVAAGDWQRLTFSLKPSKTAYPGRLAITLRGPGSVVLGYVFLQPGDWGRFKGLPVRRDVAEAMIDQGITVLRYGGDMCSVSGEYRWKKMIGPRDRRPPYRGAWYPHSSNGWGILDFLNLCEAAGFEAVPDFNINETPQDMADFIQYALGSADSEWGRRRAEDGHPQPYNLHYIELGNEQRLNDDYFRKFKALAEAIWARDPHIILVVGDFAYGERIRDPFNFKGSHSKITTLAAHEKILELAKQHDREVWFDVHMGTEGPRFDSTIPGTFSFIDALEKIAAGARFKVVVFELNAGNHSMRRALANALAINAIERDGRIPIVCSANALQPDGQNDNGWNQGLLFLNPSKVWLQPPGYVTRMFSGNYLPQLIPCRVTGPKGTLDVNGKRSEDRRTLILQAVNPTDQSVTFQIRVTGLVPSKATAQVTELSGSLDARNTAAQSNAIVSRERQHAFREKETAFTFPPRSVTIIRWE